MKKIQSLLLIPFVIVGCQSIKNNPAVTNGKPTVIEQEAGTRSPPFTSKTKHSINSRSSAKQQTISIDDNGNLSPEDISAQEEIDRALELCGSAQTLWEQGEIENALAELDMAYSAILNLDTEIHPLFSQQKEDIRYMISKRILEIYASRNIVVNGTHDAIPVIINAHVQKEIDLLTGPEKKFFIQSMERAGRYQPFIIEELKKAGIPEELSWLPLIESGFKVRALSPARALGLWQFIPSTGYKFGLNRDYYVDERLDPVKSTHAAIAYLKELHGMFGDWSTVLAAYNCGEGRVLRTIRTQNINYLDNFWDLYEKLPNETARYVPRFLATLHIVRNLDLYNMKNVRPLAPFQYKACQVKNQIKLSDIAAEIGVDANLLNDLNPELRYALLPPDEYSIRIPSTKVDTFLAKIDKIKPSSTPPEQYSYHKVRKGENLSAIAKRYNTTLHKITSDNKLSKRGHLVAGKVLKIPGTGASASRAVEKSATRSPEKTVKYTVKRGDNLWLIAGRYKTTTKKIMAKNKFGNSGILIGQEINIPSESVPSRKRSTTKSTHFVQNGDNPFTIATKYNMTLHQLFALNNLKEGSKIFPGQKLIVK